VLGASIEQTLHSVGFVLRSRPEGQAFDSLVAELLDRVVDRGFLSLPQLRDSVSRHDVKLPDLASAMELVLGDPLLLADERLSRELDGIYRRGDIYLRWFQKLSSVPFGTSTGRKLSTWLVLPLLGAFIIVDGIRLMFSPVAQWFGARPWAFDWGVFGATALVLLGLLHSESMRFAARLLLDALGWLLGLVLIRLPRAVFGAVLLQRWMRRPAVRGLLRVGLIPALLSLTVYWATAREPVPLLRWVLPFTTFAVVAIVMGSRLGYWLEDFYLEQVAPAWSTFSRQWIPALLRAISHTFSAVMNVLEAFSHRIGEALRGRRSASIVGVVVAGGAGLVWAITAYLVRLYATLLVEPEVNPLKHFPVVTVAHKFLLPFLPELLVAVERPLHVLGPFLAGAIAGVTVFLSPSIFGFLAWELKANYRLYRATRPQLVQPARFGPHGESCRELLVEGLHSGTIPKLFARLRRAAQRRLDRGLAIDAETSSLTRSELGRFYRRLEQVRHSLHRFVERELLPPLHGARRCSLHDLEVTKIDISSNRIRLRIASNARSAVLELTLEQLGGWLVASLSRRDLLTQLSRRERLLFENALAVFYQRARVDLVREQIEAELAGVVEGVCQGRGDPLEYAIDARGFTVYLPHQQLVFNLTTRFRKNLAPKVIGAKSPAAPKIRSEGLLLSQQRIRFEDWEDAWRCADEPDVDVPRLTSGASLLGP
jgi:hypothetical protein